MIDRGKKTTHTYTQAQPSTYTHTHSNTHCADGDPKKSCASPLRGGDGRHRSSERVSAEMSHFPLPDTHIHTLHSVRTNAHSQTNTHTHTQKKLNTALEILKNTACVEWKPHTSNRHSAAQRSEESLHCSSQQHNKCTQVCSVTFTNAQRLCRVSRLFAHLLKHSQVRHSLTVILLICVCSVCLASLHLDPAGVEPESPQHPGNRHVSLRSLSPVLRSLKSLRRETRGQKRGERD